jgi:carbon storage regulator
LKAFIIASSEEEAQPAREGDTMLVLTRKPGEGILIGDDIKITVVEVKGGGIRIGIEAPENKKIYRQEVYDRICQENKEATQWNIDDLNVLSGTLKGRKKR